MQPQLQEILNDYRTATARLDSLAVRVPDDQWATRPDPTRWSVSENIEHLNIMSEAFLPVFREGLERAGKSAEKVSTRYRRDPLGWFMWKVMPPPVRRLRAKTPPAFVPVETRTPEQIRERFTRLQSELVALTTAADGLPLDRVRVVSPVSSRAHYNLFAAMGIVPRHQHRHLWQAEQVFGD